jgi:uncharacterized Tic20 family protein
VVGVLLIPLILMISVVWIICVCIASARALQGGEYRYPLMIRFLD